MQEINHSSNPFPGLRPFEAAETHLFFGRDGQSEELLRRLKRTRFLAVVGTSGSGKSSLVRAGLLPALQGGLMASAGSDWRIAILRPGNDPIGNLARALASPSVLGSRGEKSAGMQEVLTETTLRRSSLGLAELVGRARTKLGTEGQPLFHDYENLLVVVDQFEEIFRFKQLIEEENSKEDAAAFVKLLLEAVQQQEGKIYVVLTMRSDFLGDCAQFRELPEAINDGQYLIPRMTRDERREAITGPVAVGQGAISEPLVNQLLNDVGDSPDQLPIMQHALMRTWDYWLGQRRNGDPMDIPDYDATGGMSEALSRHADEAYEELSDAQKVIAEKLFKGLTERGTDNREIRRPMEVEEICELTGAEEASVIAVVEVFRRGGRSFLMPPPTDALSGAPIPLTRESLIDISHESLIRNWERLKTWVEEEWRSARIYRRLAETAVLHKEGGAGLWRDPDLQVALTWREEGKPNLSWARRYHPEFALAMNFLDRSVTARDAQLASEEASRRREIKRTRLTALIFALAFLSSLAMGVYAYSKKNEAEKQKKNAYEAKDKADKALHEAETQRGIAEVEKGQAEKDKLTAEVANITAATSEAEAKKQAGIAKNKAVEADKERARADEQAQLASARALKEKKARQDAERAQQAGRTSSETNQLFRQAISYRQHGDWDNAIKNFLESIKGYEKLKESAALADTYVTLSEITGSSSSDEQKEQTVKYLDKAARLYRNIGDHKAAARTLVNLGELLRRPPDRGHHMATQEERGSDVARAVEATATLEGALVEFEAVGDRDGAIKVLTEISGAYGESGSVADRRTALKAYEKLAAYNSDDQDLPIKVAKLYFRLGEKAHGDEYVDKAIKLKRDAGDTDAQAETLTDIGEFLVGELKDKKGAGAYFDRASKVCQRGCPENQEADRFISVGKLTGDEIKDKQSTVGYFEKAVQCYRRRGDREGEAKALKEISQWFEAGAEASGGEESSPPDFGPKVKLDMALQYLQRALTVYQGTGDPLMQASTLVDTAEIYRKAGDNQHALEAVEGALALNLAADDTQRAGLLRRIAKVQSGLGENQQALETYRRALTIYEDGGAQSGLANTTLRAKTLDEIAALHVSLKQPQQAIESYQQALLIFNSYQDTSDFCINKDTPDFSINRVLRDMHKAYQGMLRQQKKQP